MNIQDLPPGLCRFPDEAWGDRFKQKEWEPTPLLPQAWDTLLSLPNPPWNRTASECRYLAGLKGPLRDGRRPEIDRQGRGFDIEATSTVQAVVGSVTVPDRPNARAAVDAVLSNIVAPIFHFKRRFKRGRPALCCGEPLDPMFPPGDRDHPAHPAYPSGHSTQAHALAFFYARLFPQLTDDLMAAAADIAWNREIAGLHYPSDSLAGKLLASQLVDMLFDNPTFAALAAAAAAEFQAGGARHSLP